MQQTVRAVYQSGQLRLLDPVDLDEGQQVNVVIQPDDKDAIRAALGDLVRWADTSDDSDAYLEMEAEAIDRAFQGTPPLSEIIIQDRGEL